MDLSLNFFVLLILQLLKVFQCRPEVGHACVYRCSECFATPPKRRLIPRLYLQDFSGCSNCLVKTLRLHITSRYIQQHIDLVLLDCLPLELVTALPVNFIQLVFLHYF